MNFNALISILDATSLVREVVDFTKAGVDATGISYNNQTGETLSASVNEETYNDLIKVCLVPNADSVKVYINNIARFKLTGMDLEDVSSFSVS